MHIKLGLIVFFSVVTFRPELPCPVEAMLEQVLAQQLFDSHRGSDSDYYLFENELTEGCEPVKFGDKMLRLTDSQEGNVFIVKELEYRSLKTEANLKVLLESDNLLIDAWFSRSEDGLKLKRLSFIET